VSQWSTYAAVFLGGGLGSVARFGLSALLNKGHQFFHWGTFSANMLGCLLIGALVPFFSKTPHSTLALFAIAGFCGGFTTFSTLSWESLKLLERFGVGLYLLYVGSSILIGLSLTYGGYRAVLQLFKF
jgi:CrcB protein